MKFGWKHSLPKLSIKYKNLITENAVKPAASSDLQPLCPPIEDQGNFGTCVAHATVGSLEFLEIADIKSVQDNAPEVFAPVFNTISRFFIYANARIIDGTSLAEDNGTTPSSAIKAIQTKGICKESDWPYIEKLLKQMPSQQCYKEANSHKILFDYALNNTNVDELKTCLTAGFPIIFGISCYDSMMSDETAKTGYIPLPKIGESNIGGHCMMIVGHDDATSKFKIRNSWGVKWGLAGYGTMDYAYLTNPDLASDFWTLRKKSQIV